MKHVKISSSNQITGRVVVGSSCAIANWLRTSISAYYSHYEIISHEYDRLRHTRSVVMMGITIITLFQASIEKNGYVR